MRKAAGISPDSGEEQTTSQNYAKPPTEPEFQEWNQELERKVQERTIQLHEAHRVTLSFYEELKKNFESTLEVLSIAIDQRDPLTSSHSFRVTEYALEIGRQLNLGLQDLEKLRYAGLMHDLGKIELKETILTKEGSLSSTEYKEIQTL